MSFGPLHFHTSKPTSFTSYIHKIFDWVYIKCLPNLLNSPEMKSKRNNFILFCFPAGLSILILTLLWTWLPCQNDSQDFILFDLDKLITHLHLFKAYKKTMNLFKSFNLYAWNAISGANNDYFSVIDKLLVTRSSFLIIYPTVLSFKGKLKGLESFLNYNKDKLFCFDQIIESL